MDEDIGAVDIEAVISTLSGFYWREEHVLIADQGSRNHTHGWPCILHGDDWVRTVVSERSKFAETQMPEPEEEVDQENENTGPEKDTSSVENAQEIQVICKLESLVEALSHSLLPRPGHLLARLKGAGCSCRPTPPRKEGEIPPLQIPPSLKQNNPNPTPFDLLDTKYQLISYFRNLLNTICQMTTFPGPTSDAATLILQEADTILRLCIDAEQGNIYATRVLTILKCYLCKPYRRTFQVHTPFNGLGRLFEAEFFKEFIDRMGCDIFLDLRMEDVRENYIDFYVEAPCMEDFITIRRTISSRVTEMQKQDSWEIPPIDKDITNEKAPKPGRVPPHKMPIQIASTESECSANPGDANSNSESGDTQQQSKITEFYSTKGQDESPSPSADNPTALGNPTSLGKRLVKSSLVINLKRSTSEPAGSGQDKSQRQRLSDSTGSDSPVDGSGKGVGPGTGARSKVGVVAGMAGGIRAVLGSMLSMIPVPVHKLKAAARNRRGPSSIKDGFLPKSKSRHKDDMIFHQSSQDCVKIEDRFSTDEHTAVKTGVSATDEKQRYVEDIQNTPDHTDYEDFDTNDEYYDVEEEYVSDDGTIIMSTCKLKENPIVDDDCIEYDITHNRGKHKKSLGGLDSEDGDMQYCDMINLFEDEPMPDGANYNSGNTDTHDTLDHVKHKKSQDYPKDAVHDLLSSDASGRDSALGASIGSCSSTDENAQLQQLMEDYSESEMEQKIIEMKMNVYRTIMSSESH